MTRCFSTFITTIYAVVIVLTGWSTGSWAADAAGLSVDAEARADALIVCVAETSDQELSVTLEPGMDVFAMQHLNFDNGHRVTLQWLQKPDRLKTYVYQDSKNRLVLINSQVYMLSDSLTNAGRCGQRMVDARTYSGEYEREVSLLCEWLCDSGAKP